MDSRLHPSSLVRPLETSHRIHAPTPKRRGTVDHPTSRRVSSRRQSRSSFTRASCRQAAGCPGGVVSCSIRQPERSGMWSLPTVSATWTWCSLIYITSKTAGDRAPRYDGCPVGRPGPRGTSSCPAVRRHGSVTERSTSTCIPPRPSTGRFARTSSGECRRGVRVSVTDRVAGHRASCLRLV